MFFNIRKKAVKKPIERPVKIKDTINLDIIDWVDLSGKPQFIDIIEQHLNSYVNWTTLSSNPNAIHIIKKELERVGYRWSGSGSDNRVDIDWLAINPNAIFIIEELLELPNSDFKSIVYSDRGEDFWNFLSMNPNSYSILKKNIKKVNWNMLALNSNVTFIFTNLLNDECLDIDRDISSIEKLPNFNYNEFIKKIASNTQAIEIYKKIYKHELYEEHYDKLLQNPNAMSIITKNKMINWNSLSSNINAIDLIVNIKLKDHTSRKKIKLQGETFDSFHEESYYFEGDIDWDILSSNVNAIDILQQNQHKINWKKLSSNKKAIKILEKNLDKINMQELSLNPNAFAMFEDINFDNLKHKELIDYLVKINYITKVGDEYKVDFNYYSDYMKDFTYYFSEENDFKIPRLQGHYLNNIFKVNYKFLKQRMESTIGEELIQAMFHPKNINKFEGWGFNDDCDI